jgi:hypothetical protein
MALEISKQSSGSPTSGIPRLPEESADLNNQSIIGIIIHEWRIATFGSKLIAWICILVEIVKLIMFYQYKRFTLFQKMAGDPYMIMYYSEWYRVFTSPYAFSSIIQLGVGLSFFIVEFSRYELEWGFSRAIISFLWKNLLIHLTWISIELTIYPYIFDQFFLTWGNSGLWAVTATHIIQRWYHDPDGYISVMYRKKMPNKRYIGFFILVGGVVSIGFRPVDVIAMMIGLVQVHLLDYPINNILNKLSCICGWIFSTGIENKPYDVEAEAKKSENNQKDTFSERN